MSSDQARHWDGVFRSKAVDEVSWFQARPETSLRLLAGVSRPTGAVVDVGAGASTLVDELLERGWVDVTVLDVSVAALAVVRTRLAGRTAPVTFVAADLLSWQPDRQYDVWHDRAVFHFLVDAADRQRYVDTAARAVRPGGHLVLATFAADGPTACSGLPTARYDAAALAAELAAAFDLVHDEREEHRTPAGVLQPFTWVVLRRRGGPAQGAR